MIYQGNSKWIYQKLITHFYFRNVPSDEDTRKFEEELKKEQDVNTNVWQHLFITS